MLKHILNKHSTREERKDKFKYYCELCDYVFFCKKYLDKHLSGRNHNTKLKVKQSLDELEIKIKNYLNVIVFFMKS